MLPNFFIVGAPKAGTTSLYHYLDQHPEIYMSAIKEPCYFASELRPEHYSDELRPWIAKEMKSLRKYLDGPMTEKRFGGLVSKRADYLKLFEKAGGARAVGEASVCYLWSPSAARNIHAAIPDAKIVMILRNPVDRAFSQYTHAVNLGATRKSFRQQIDASLQPRNGIFGKLYPFLDFGLYYEQVKRYRDLFPETNVRIYLYEDYRDQPRKMLSRLFEYLDASPNFEPILSERRLEPRIPRSLDVSYFLAKCRLGRSLIMCLPSIAFKPRQSVSLRPEDRAYLCGYYEEDVRKLSDLLECDLNHWLKRP